jgi:hypothetical protein
VKKSVSPLLLSLLALLAAPGAALRAAEGMWLPEQTSALAPELRRLGLEMDPARLADFSGDPMRAIASLGGCSASFVSATGLIVTNHHCVYGYLQYNSTGSKNLLETGFLARTPAEEIPASPDARVWVTVAMDDVTSAVLPPRGAELSDRERFRRVERRRKEIVRDCERERGVRCLVPEFSEGARYLRVKQEEIRDVRLVYAPPRGIGNYGGEVDNWMWPRHTGDFGFLRAYVGPDGKAADAAPENVPYRPRHFLKVSTADLSPGDLAVVIGYPGKTYRYRLAEEVRDAQEFDLPTSIRYRRALMALLEEAGRGGREIAIKNASRIRSLANYLKKHEGTLEAFARGGLLARRTDEEKRLAALSASDAAGGPRLRDALAGIGRWNAALRRTRERDAVLAWLLDGSPMLSQAHTLWRLARERGKEDVERATGFQERDWKRLRASLSRAQAAIEPASDRAGLRFFLLEAARLPAGQRIRAVDEALAATGAEDPAASVERLLDRLYGGTRVGDLAQRRAMFEESPERLAARRDPMLELAAALRRDLDEKERRDEEVQGAMLRLRPVYVEWLEKVRGGRLYPDANGTLRVSFGRVAGYSPRDSVVYGAQTTLSGVLQKRTGANPFDPPAPLLAATAGKRLGPYVDPDLRDVPVDFLSEGDITNGSSGSATLNARGELCGLAFDGNYEAMGSDYLVTPSVTRTIHVDTRYMLWVMDAVDGAHRLLTEMGLPVRFPGPAEAASRTAAP